MRRHGPRIAGLLAILAALVLTPCAHAADSAKQAPSSTTDELRAYGTHCKTRKGRASEGAQC